MQNSSVSTISHLRILIISNLYPPQVIGGYERAIADFASLLKQRGHEVVVLTSNTEGLTTNCSLPDMEPVVQRSLLLGGQWTSQGAVWLPMDQLSLVDEQNYHTISQVLQSFQPQVCLAGNIDFFGTPIFAPLLSARIPIAHYVMNKQPGYPPELTPDGALYRYVTCSDWVLQSLRDAGYPIDKAEVIYPGAAVDEFYQAELPPRDLLRIAYASLVMPYKGADVLLEALCLLSAAEISFSATIAGGTLMPEFVQAMQQFIESEGLQEQIHLPGVLSRQQLSHLYKTHNVLVFPSRFEEPFGISQVEAMAAGLTLITSGTGGAKEIVISGEDGFLFESENPFALAEVLSFLPTQPDTWEAITRKGQEKALTQFNQVKATEQLEVLLVNLISQAG